MHGVPALRLLGLAETGDLMDVALPATHTLHDARLHADIALSTRLCTCRSPATQFPHTALSPDDLNDRGRFGLYYRVFVKSGRQNFRMFKSGGHLHKW